MEDNHYIPGGPGIRGIFQEVEPGYGYLGPIDVLGDVQFTGSALNRYFGLPPTAGAEVSSNLPVMAQPSASEQYPIASPQTFAGKAEALGALEKMYKSLIGDIHPSALSGPSGRDIGYPVLLLGDKPLDRNAAARYTAPANRIEIPVTENLFVAGNYYPRSASIAVNDTGEPRIVKQLFSYKDETGPLDTLAYGHELGHAFDNRVMPGNAFASYLRNSGLWPHILSAYGGERTATVSEDIDPIEGFASLFERAIDRELAQRAGGLGDIPYREKEIINWKPEEEDVTSFEKARRLGKEKYQEMKKTAQKQAGKVEKKLKIPKSQMPGEREKITREAMLEVGNKAISQQPKLINPSGYGIGWKEAYGSDMGNFLDWYFQNIYPSNFNEVGGTEEE